MKVVLILLSLLSFISSIFFNFTSIHSIYSSEKKKKGNSVLFLTVFPCPVNTQANLACAAESVEGIHCKEAPEKRLPLQCITPRGPQDVNGNK